MAFFLYQARHAADPEPRDVELEGTGKNRQDDAFRLSGPITFTCHGAGQTYCPMEPSPYVFVNPTPGPADSLPEICARFFIAQIPGLHRQ
jgi:hypothetical protein